MKPGTGCVFACGSNRRYGDYTASDELRIVCGNRLCCLTSFNKIKIPEIAKILDKKRDLHLTPVLALSTNKMAVKPGYIGSNVPGWLKERAKSHYFIAIIELYRQDRDLSTYGDVVKAGFPLSTFCSRARGENNQQVLFPTFVFANGLIDQTL